VDNGNAAAVFLRRAHLREQMHQEQQLPIGLTRQPGAEATIEAKVGVLIADGLLDLAPIDAERRIRDAVVEVGALVPIVRE
jgi:hypothetical protein